MADIDLDPLNYESQYHLDRAITVATDEANNLENHIKELNRKIGAQRNQKGGPDKTLMDEARAVRDKINARRAFVKSATTVKPQLPAMPAGFATPAEKESALRQQKAQGQVAANKFKLEDALDMSPGKARALDMYGKSGFMNAVRGMAPIAPTWYNVLGMAVNPLTLGMSPERLGAVFGAGEMVSDPRKAMAVTPAGVDTGVSKGAAARNPEALVPAIEKNTKIVPGTPTSVAGELIGDTAINTSKQAASDIEKGTNFRGGLGAGVKIGNTALYGYGAYKLLDNLLGSSPDRPIGEDTELTPEQRDFISSKLEPLRERANMPKLEEKLKLRKVMEDSAAKILRARMGANPMVSQFTKAEIDDIFPHDPAFDATKSATGLSVDELSDPSNSRKLNMLLKDADKSQPILLGRNNARAKIAIHDKTLEGGTGGWHVAEIPFDRKGMSLNYAPDELDRKFGSDIKTLKDYRKLEGGEMAIKSFKEQKNKPKGNVTVE